MSRKVTCKICSAELEECPACHFKMICRPCECCYACRARFRIRDGEIIAVRTKRRKGKPVDPGPF